MQTADCIYELLTQIFKLYLTQNQQTLSPAEKDQQTQCGLIEVLETIIQYNAFSIMVSFNQLDLLN